MNDSIIANLLAQKKPILEVLRELETDQLLDEIFASPEAKQLKPLIDGFKTEIGNRDQALDDFKGRVRKALDDLAGIHDHLWMFQLKHTFARVFDPRHDLSWSFIEEHPGCQCDGCSNPQPKDMGNITVKPDPNVVVTAKPGPVVTNENAGVKHDPGIVVTS